MKLRPHQRISLDLAKARALDALSDYPINASVIADAIWPDHEMKAQGAGAAAVRILTVLRKEGRAAWTSTRYKWGWVKR